MTDPSLPLNDLDSVQLLELLRCRQNAMLRLAAARELGERRDPEMVHNLLRSLLEDPDSEVSDAARDALFQTLGEEQAAETIRDFVDDDEDFWLVSQASELIERLSGQVTRKIKGFPNPEACLIAQDRERLILTLRYRPDPHVRRRAVLAMREMADFDMEASLLRASSEDPDEPVREMARDLLTEILGVEAAEQAILAYRSGEGSLEPWLLEAEGEDLQEAERQLFASASRLDSLLCDAVRDAGPEARTLAVRALARVGNLGILEALISGVLYSDDADIEGPARHALELYFGAETDLVIDVFRGPDASNGGKVKSPVVSTEKPPVAESSARQPVAAVTTEPTGCGSKMLGFFLLCAAGVGILAVLRL